MRFKSKKFILPLIIACFSVVILTASVFLFFGDENSVLP